MPDAPATGFHRCGLSAWHHYFINILRYICGVLQKKMNPSSYKKETADKRTINTFGQYYLNGAGVAIP
jgi:hypothetical protein